MRAIAQGADASTAKEHSTSGEEKKMLQSLKKGAELLLLLLSSSLSGFELLLLQLLMPSTIPSTISLVCKTVIDCCFLRSGVSLNTERDCKVFFNNLLSGKRQSRPKFHLPFLYVLFLGVSDQAAQKRTASIVIKLLRRCVF